MMNNATNLPSIVLQYALIAAATLLAVAVLVAVARYISTKWKMLKAPFREVFKRHPLKLIPIAAFAIAGCFGIWRYLPSLLALYPFDTSAPLYAAISKALYPAAMVVLVAGMFLLVLVFGRPFRAKSTNQKINDSGFENITDRGSGLIAKYKSKKPPHAEVMEVNTTIPLLRWRKQQDALEANLNKTIAKIEQGEDYRSVVLYTLPPSTQLPERVDWRREYLNSDGFVLVFGVSLLGPVSINLDVMPHILIGGSSGSGKSVMLKSGVMQCVEQNAIAYLADFKGGVDYPPVWHQRCRMVVDEESLLDVLREIIEELERRKKILLAANCRKIGEYNQNAATPLPRIVFACDEVAELLDKTGLTKEGKERVAQIEAKLATVARLGRSFGIHLLLATQRPDATILAGQIRNNIDGRICGRADNVLSQIILDNTDASDKIPKDAQGRFLLHDGTLFQGYWFDDSDW